MPYAVVLTTRSIEYIPALMCIAAPTCMLRLLPFNYCTPQHMKHPQSVQRRHAVG